LEAIILQHDYLPFCVGGGFRCQPNLLLGQPNLLLGDWSIVMNGLAPTVHASSYATTAWSKTK